ncbi:unnamed protein product [Lactuca saligna]|uniref:Glycerol-3-phosphate acyltransferase RAM2/GPAT1-8 HAD-like domain-containing protein n=1 Tax=Lactuca saligna TaxID=75948 RepID=A0AA35YS39_LACSI|nr:unnamed protein product [Lactuca saligna]
MGKMLPPEMKTGKKSFPPMSKCDLSSVSHLSIAADLDGTLLKASLPFLYYVLLAIEAGSLLRGLILMLSLPIIAIVCIFISEDLAGKILIFLAFFGVKVSDLENASRAVLPWFYAMDVRSDSFELFNSCRRKVVVTANPTVMVDAFAQEFLGADKVLGTEIEVDPWTERATGFVKAPGILVGKLKKMAVQKEFGEDMPDIGLGDRKSDHDFMSICKEGYMVPRDHSASIISPYRLKNKMILQLHHNHNHNDSPLQQPRNALITTYIRLPFTFIHSFVSLYFNLSLLKAIIRSAIY